MKVYKWWGLSSAIHRDCVNHLRQHMGLVDGKKYGEISFSCWFSVIWSIWLMRNKATFEDKLMDMDQVCDLVKIRTWMWASANFSGFGGVILLWFVDPCSCVK